MCTGNVKFRTDMGKSSQYDAIDIHLAENEGAGNKRLNRELLIRCGLFADYDVCTEIEKKGLK